MHVYNVPPAEYTARAAFFGVQDTSDFVHKFFLIMYANILMSSSVTPTIIYAEILFYSSIYHSILFIICNIVVATY